jgi:Spy/CpxP family protein refolding chaperone
MRKTVLLGLLFAASLSHAADKSPYAGEELRSVKSLSPQEIESLRSGHGMGFAKVAELNHYPGPKHVLDLAEDLELTPVQQSQTDKIFRRMHDEAVALGEQLVEAELELDRQFERGTIDPKSLEDALLRIGELTGRLRNVHLKAHLDQERVLTSEQVAKYDELRGYRHSGPHSTESHKSHH